MYLSSASALLLRGNRVDESAFGAPITLQGAAWVAGDPFGGDAHRPDCWSRHDQGNVRSAVNNTEWAWSSGASRPPPLRMATTSLTSASRQSQVIPTWAFLCCPPGHSLCSRLWMDKAGSMCPAIRGSVPNGSWSYLEVTRRGNTLIAAVNAVDVISYPVSGTFAPLSPGNIRIGGNPLSGFGNRNFLGLLGPMRLTQGGPSWRWRLRCPCRLQRSRRRHQH